MEPWTGALVGLAAGALGAWLAVRRRAPAAPVPDPRLEVVERREERLLERAVALDRRDDALREAEHRVARREAELEVRLEEARSRVLAAETLEALRRTEKEQGAADARRLLAEIAGSTEEEARRRLLAEIDHELEGEKARRLASTLETTRLEAEERSREILLVAMQRMAASTCATSSVARVALENEEMKGRVIGREGRNIRAFESATGCDVMLDETAGYVTLSGFDPVRREVARLAMERLLADGRMQPARIEEVVAEAAAGIDRQIVETGRAACLEADVHDLHPQLVQMLGRMAFRSSYGQNALRHSIESARLAGMVAAEIGLEPRIARRAALLHDIGKVADPSLEGTHHQVAADIARRCDEDEVIVNAIACSHESQEVATPYAVVAQIADAISASRPGARREESERVVKRMQDLEALAGAFPGVAQAYALQAGREIRVIVDAGKVSDVTAPLLAHEVARAVEARLKYPGEVKVTVVRETRATDVAR